MTYAQLRRSLSEIAAYGDGGAPHACLPVARWLDLRTARCVVQVGDRWSLTVRGWAVLDEPTMATRRPSERPTHHARRAMRKSA